jgi:hypothetical protein
MAKTDPATFSRAKCRIISPKTDPGDKPEHQILFQSDSDKLEEKKVEMPRRA